MSLSKGPERVEPEKVEGFDKIEWPIENWSPGLLKGNVLQIGRMVNGHVQVVAELIFDGRRVKIENHLDPYRPGPTISGDIGEEKEDFDLGDLPHRFGVPELQTLLPKEAFRVKSTVIDDEPGEEFAQVVFKLLNQGESLFIRHMDAGEVRDEVERTGQVPLGLVEKPAFPEKPLVLAGGESGELAAPDGLSQGFSSGAGIVNKDAVCLAPESSMVAVVDADGSKGEIAATVVLDIIKSGAGKEIHVNDIMRAIPMALREKESLKGVMPHASLAFVRTFMDARSKQLFAEVVCVGRTKVLIVDADSAACVYASKDEGKGLREAGLFGAASAQGFSLGFTTDTVPVNNDNLFAVAYTDGLAALFDEAEIVAIVSRLKHAASGEIHRMAIARQTKKSILGGSFRDDMSLAVMKV